MKERPILFSAPMVRAILDGSKTQTRRVVKYPPRWSHDCWMRDAMDGKPGAPPWPHCLCESGRYEKLPCPFGVPGEQLWVRETWALHPDDHPDFAGLLYRATDPGWDENETGLRWKPSIFMRREYSRIALEVTGVRVERLRDISEEDARAEGAERMLRFGMLYQAPCDHPECADASCRDGFRFIWESINGPESWEANPYVWVIEFRRVKP